MDRLIGAAALLFAAYSFGNVFGEIYWGRQSDIWGRRKVLLVTTLVATAMGLAAAIPAAIFMWPPG